MAAYTVGSPVTHARWGAGIVLSVDATSFRIDAETPILMLVVAFPAGEIYLSAGEVEGVN